MYQERTKSHLEVPSSRVKWLKVIILFMLLIGSNSHIVLAQGTPPVETDALLEQIELSTETNSAGIAWGNPDGPHSTYAWPFSVVQMGHAIQSFQYYGGSPYFHHGIDMIAPNGTDVYNYSGGQVVNVENYTPGNDLYWEIAILDPEGYVWQYHHIDKNTIPQLIKDKFTEWKANPTTGGFIPAGTYIGDIVYWTVTSFGYRFNHIHLNILAAGDVYLNTMEFHPLLSDTQNPEIVQIGLTKNNTVQSGNTVSGEYGLYVRARDLFLSSVYYLPPYKTEFSIDGGPWTTVWEFHDLPGGASDTSYVTDFYVYPPTCGDYSCRDFYIDLGFTTSILAVEPGITAQRPLPTSGEHTIQVKVWDYNGNSATGSFTWTVYSSFENTSSSAIADNGCASGTGVTRTFNVTEEFLVTDVNVGLNLSHATRGQLQVTLQAPGDAAATTLVSTASDNYDNYDVLLDDASSNNINDGSNDTTASPYYEADRRAGPRPDGSLDSFNGKNSLGTWTMTICDGASGVTGTVNRVKLDLVGNFNRAPTAAILGANPIDVNTNQVDLSGSLTDDGLPKTPGLVTSTWSLVSAPQGGEVMFDNNPQVGTVPRTHNTRASFSLPGSYTLQLSATDGTLAATPAQVVVNADFIPTAVDVVSFTANFVSPQAVQVGWTAVNESEIAGYNLYRSTSLDGERVLVNPSLIPVHIDQPEQPYTFLDENAAGSGRFYYWLFQLLAPNNAEVQVSGLDPAIAIYRDQYLFLPLAKR